MKNYEEKTKKHLTMSKEQEQHINATLTRYHALLAKYNDATKRDDALKDVEYVELCANIINFHLFLRTALSSLKKDYEKVFEKMFSIYILLHSYTLPTLPDLELFFKQVANSNAEKDFAKVAKTAKVVENKEVI